MVSRAFLLAELHGVYFFSLLSVCCAIARHFPLVSEKLTYNNYVLWKAQVLLGLKGAQLAKFITPNLEL